MMVSEFRRRWALLKAAFGPKSAKPRLVTHVYLNGEEVRRIVDARVAENFEKLLDSIDPPRSNL